MHESAFKRVASTFKCTDAGHEPNRNEFPVESIAWDEVMVPGGTCTTFILRCNKSFFFFFYESLHWVVLVHKTPQVRFEPFEQGTEISENSGYLQK